MRFVNKNERKKEREKEKASIQNQRLALIPVGSKLPFFWNLKIQKSNIQVFYLKGQNFPRFSQHSKKLQRRRALQTQVLAAYRWDSVSISGASFLFIQSSDFVFYLKELIIFHTPCNSQVSNTRFKIYKKRIGVCIGDGEITSTKWVDVRGSHAFGIIWIWSVVKVTRGKNKIVVCCRGKWAFDVAFSLNHCTRIVMIY